MAKTKTVLIAGAAGFIGSHLCDHFIGRGDRVIALDNLITGTTGNLRHLSGERRFSFRKTDISKPFRIAGKVDVVLSFASPASPPDYLRHPIETLDVGSAGTRNLLEIARAKKAVFLHASTSEVYGDPEVSPQKESYWGRVNPIGPRSVYDEAKRFSEALVMAYHRRHGVNTKLVRIFNTYGRRMRPEDGRVIPNFAVQALLGKPLTVYGKGDQTRSYCHVDDLVRGIHAVLFSRLHMPDNLGNPNEMSVLKLAKTILRMTGSKSPIVYRELPVDDPKQRCPDIALAKQELGWAPRVALEEGLAQTLEYFAEALSLAYLRRHRLDVKIIRIFNTYGDRMRLEDGRVIPNFISQALLKKPLTVYGNGKQTRSYCYIDDLVEGIDKMLHSKYSGPFNLGNPNEMPVLGLAKVIIRLTGSKSPIVFKPLPVDDPKQRCPDIALAKKALGWTPKVPLEAGLGKTIRYFEKALFHQSHPR